MKRPRPRGCKLTPLLPEPEAEPRVEWYAAEDEHRAWDSDPEQEELIPRDENDAAR